MYTNEDRRKIAKALTDGDFFDILIICMMRNGATFEELEEAKSISIDASNYALNKIVYFTDKYYDVSEEALNNGR